MISLPALSICNIVQGKLISGPSDRLASGGVCTDSRKIIPHSVFFALGGENFDGNSFAPEASQAASVVVVSQIAPGIDPSCAVILVDHVLEALQLLATWWRNQLNNLTVVGLTGSNGKTSTKDFTSAIFREAGKTTATLGNLNNHIGVPLSILQATPEDQFAIWEMGMNHAGELLPLCKMVQPKFGIITSIGTSHIEFLGTREAIAEEKCTLAHSLPKMGALAYPAHCDFAAYIESCTDAALLSVGIEQGVVQAKNLQASATGTTFTLCIPNWEEIELFIPVQGEHMVCNALLAAAIAWKAGLTPEMIAKGLKNTTLTAGRLHCKVVKGITIIDDTYNANPDSMKAALKTLKDMPTTGKRIAVLGKMGELGHFSDKGHTLVGQEAQKLHIDQVITIGNEASRISEAITQGSKTHALHFNDADQAADWIKEHVVAGDIILFKGSRSARMELLMNNCF